MSKKLFCVDRRTKFFKNLVSSLNIHPDNLENILHQIDREGMTPEELEAKVRSTIKEGATTAMDDESMLNNALTIWKTYTQDGYIEFDGPVAADSYETLLKESFGAENIYRYNTADGKPAIRVAKPVLRGGSDMSDSALEEIMSSTVNPMEEAARIVDILKEYSDKHIKFNYKAHKYTVDGQVVDTSVTQYIYGKKDIGAWGIPSSALGNTVDRVTRDFFSGELQKSYPNLTKGGLSTLIDGLKDFQKILDKKFGGRENYRVITDNFYIASQFTTYDEKTGQPITGLMAGAMDMLIYDKEGNFYIYDMKTKRSGISEEDRQNYSKQLSLYKAILEANFPQLQGRIKELKLIQFDTYYAKPLEVGGSVSYETDSEGQLYADGEPIQDYEDAEYEQPQLSITGIADLVDADMLSFEEEFESLVDFDKILAEEQFGKPSKQSPYQATELNRKKNALYNNPLLTAEERSFLANSLMKTTSFIITHLQTNPKASQYYFGNEFNADFTKMSRSEIVNTIGLNRIFNWVKENYFNSDNREDIEDEVTLKKLDIAYDNWEALKQEGYATLIMLEDVTVIQADQVIKEGVDAQMQEDMDSGNAEQHEREYWQVNFRQISAMASLSTRVRRELERLQVLEINEDGELVQKLDNTFGMPTYVDSGVAVSSILEWVKDCTTISEMENALRELAPAYPWLSSIVGMHENGVDIHGLMEDEPFRSQFYSNFRRDFTEYSVVRVEFDADGNRKYVTQIINTKGATRFLLDQVVNSYQEGLMTDIIIPIKGDIEGRGRVNTRVVSRLIKEHATLNKELSQAFSKGRRQFKSQLSASVDLIASHLNTLGIRVTPQNVETLIMRDTDLGNYSATRVANLMKEIQYMLNTLNEHRDERDYNPMLKGAKGNLYNDYKNIIQMFSKFVQDGIEASTYENGKMYYSFQTPSYMGKLITNLKDALNNPDKFEDFIRENYAKYRWFYEQGDNPDSIADGEWYNMWLKSLVTSSDARAALDHKVQLAFDGTDYRDLSEMAYTLSLMSEYFYDSKGKYAWYRMPILSNKPSSEFIRFTRHSGRRYKQKIMRGLVSTAEQEILRMRTVLDRAGMASAISIDNWDISAEILSKNPSLQTKLKNKQPLTFEDLVKDGKLVTAGSGAEFKFMQALNSELVNETELGQMILNQLNGVEMSDDEYSDFIDLLEDAIDRDMNIIVQQEQDKWSDIGLYETEDQEFTWEEGKGKDKETVKITLPRYKYLQSFTASPVEVYKEMAKKKEYAKRFKKDGSLKPEFLEAFREEMRDRVNAALEEYVWNDLFATINIIELTATDLAYFKNVEDFQKRYAAVHSPGIRPNIEATDSKGQKYSKDGICRVIHIADSMEASDIVENVRQVFESRIAQAKTAKEKAELKKMADLIISGFEKFNVTDGQGYSSPTSYRKKMCMLGRWSEAEERAYENIKKGNFTVEDLGIVWQPLKPFVYTQMDKTTGSDVMSEVKVPMLVKDSEYMLLLADALMRGGGKQSKLTAIFDFMEDSAYDGRESDNGKVSNVGTYNGIGIDTIAFVSASKVGSAGVVDINDAAIAKYRKTNPEFAEASDYEIMKQILEDAAYYNSDHTEDIDNNMGRYDDRYVHEFSFEDYALQQEVPAHLRDHEQPMGSQIRILSISDVDQNADFVMSDGVLKGSSLVQEYQELIAENVMDSFNRLAREFNIDSSDRYKRNKAIEKLLTETILKDQRYGVDLLRACTLNDQGEFTIPLCDPIQSIRIQQLINSIIKSRINKQKVKGGPVVQTSVYGMSDDLHIRFKDKKGNLLMTLSEFSKKNGLSGKEATTSYKDYVKRNQGDLAYWEVYMPIPSEVMETALIEAGKKNGKDYFNDVEAAVKDKVIDAEMLKAIGYRIPTEDKYSMAPMRVKGFMPRAAGEAIMMPKEVTLLTGSDFDIDKMYIMLKDFTQNDYYNIEEAWEDFYQNSPEGREARRVIDTAKENAIQEAIAKMSENPSEYEDFLELNEDELRKALLRVAKEQGLDRDYKWVDGVQQAFSKWFDRKQKEAHKAGKRFRELKGRGNRAGRNNRIFDLQWAVLTGADTASKMFNPGSFDVQKKTARIINILKDPSNKHTYDELAAMTLSQLDELTAASTGKNILRSTTQVYFHKQNMTAGKLIGIFANNNTSHAFVSLQHINLELGDKFAFSFDNSVSPIMEDRLDPMKARDGVTLISKNIAGYLAASVDAVKDPVLNFLNLNTFTSGSAMVLTRLGFDVDSVGLLMTQPIIERATNEYFRRNNEGYVSQDDVIDELKEWIKDEYGIDYMTLEDDLVNTRFSKSDMAQGLQSRVANMTQQQAEFQLRALMLFQRLTKIANQMQTLTFLTKFNSVTNAPGPTIADSLVMRERYNRFKQLYDDGTNLLSDSALQVINNSPILKAFYDTTISDRGASKKIFDPFFPHYSTSFGGVLERMSQFMKTAPDAKLINMLVNDYILYKLTAGDNPVINTSREERERFIHDFIKEFRERAYNAGSNALLDIIQVKARDKRCPVPTLEAKTGSFNATAQENVKNAWSALMQNERTHDLAVDLFFYNIMRSGFAFSPKTFTHLASVDVKLAVDRYVETLRDPNFNDVVVDYAQDDFLFQFRRNHASDGRLAPKVREHEKLKTSYSKGKITFTFPKKGISPAFVLNSQKIDLDHLAPVIWYKDKLYMMPQDFIESGASVSVTYELTTPLGNTNNFLEYNANSEEGGAYMKTAMEQTIERETEEPQEVSKDSAEGQEEDALTRWERLSDEEEDLLLNEVFTSDELRGLKGIKDANARATKAIDLVMKHLESAKGGSKPKAYKGLIKSSDSAVFVFGSNGASFNGNPARGTGGAALSALQQGRIEQRENMANRFSKSGKAYGIQTVTSPGARKSLSKEDIIENIKQFYKEAVKHSSQTFKVAYNNIGSKTSLNGYSGDEMLQMFVDAGPAPSNVLFSEEWVDNWPSQKGRAYDRQFRKELEEIVDKLC